MSDTTITPRKRKELREYALDCKGEMNRNYFICHLEPDTVLNLLDTIEQAESRIDGGCIEELKRATELAEQAEARAERAEKELAGADAEISELRDELEDFRGTEKDAPNILCAIARLVGVYEYSQELGDDVGEVTLDAVRDLLADKQTAEANVARLTKMVDWLAKALAEDGCPYLALWSDFGSEMRPDWCICIDTADDGFDCNGDAKECWKKEAARRAVAAGEEPCPKQP